MLHIALRLAGMEHVRQEINDLAMRCPQSVVCTSMRTASCRICFASPQRHHQQRNRELPSSLFAQVIYSLHPHLVIICMQRQPDMSSHRSNGLQNTASADNCSHDPLGGCLASLHQKFSSWCCRPLCEWDRAELVALHVALFPINYEDGFYNSAVRNETGFFTLAAILRCREQMLKHSFSHPFLANAMTPSCLPAGPTLYSLSHCNVAL